jgi:hypothetical protein
MLHKYNMRSNPNFNRASLPMQHTKKNGDDMKSPPLAENGTATPPYRHHPGP